jgi:hypothetical protein
MDRIAQRAIGTSILRLEPTFDHPIDFVWLMLGMARKADEDLRAAAVNGRSSSPDATSGLWFAASDRGVESESSTG